jgi:hypothetical protein
MKATEIISLLVPIGSFVVSTGALLVSVVSLRRANRANKAALLSCRLKAINHIREAFGDLALHGVVEAKTTAAIREAFQLSSLVFERSVSDTLEKLHGIAFRLEHKSVDRYTEQDESEKESLTSQIGGVLERMRSQAAIQG